MTPSEALDALFAYPVGRKLTARRQSDGAAVVVEVVGRSVQQAGREVFLSYVLRGEGGTVSHPKELVERAMQ